MDNEKITKQLINYCEMLPEICTSYLLETGTQLSVTTRLAYAKELSTFFDYLISYSPVFCDCEKNNINKELIEQITSQDISRYLTIYKDQGHSEKTTARKRAALSSYFNYLVANRIVSFNPVQAAVRVKLHKSDEVIYLEINDQIKLLDSVDSGNDLSKRKQAYHNKYRLRDNALCTLLLDTGIRVSELRGINIEDLDLEKCSVIITRKGGKIQTVYFSDETTEKIQDYLLERKNKEKNLSKKDPLFVTLKGERLSVRAIEVLVKKYSESSLPGKGSKITPHKLRSSFAMGFYEETKDILALQRKLGHDGLAATNIYAKATDKKMQETRNILENRRKNNS